MPDITPARSLHQKPETGFLRQYLRQNKKIPFVEYKEIWRSIALELTDPLDFRADSPFQSKRSKVPIQEKLNTVALGLMSRSEPGKTRGNLPRVKYIIPAGVRQRFLTHSINYCSGIGIISLGVLTV